MTKKDAKAIVTCLEQIPENFRTELQVQQLAKYRKAAGVKSDKLDPTVELSEEFRAKLSAMLYDYKQFILVGESSVSGQSITTAKTDYDASYLSLCEYVLKLEKKAAKKK